MSDCDIRPAPAGPTPLVLIRHGATDWTEQGRVQGRSDRPLSPAGLAQVRRWRLPPAFETYDWVTSPLLRARETAALLGHDEAAVVEALVEASWGGWEGQRLPALRARLGPAMARMEAHGLDFKPPEGESPRQVQVRLTPWLNRVARAGRPTLAISHKGILRAVYALAARWDMRADPPEKLRDDCAHSFLLVPEEPPTAARLNQSLLP